jgi:hypothetical protein
MKQEILGLAATVLLITGPASAATLEYDCDTAPNHFSELKQELGQGPVVISGMLTARAMAASKTYAPMTRVTLESADGADGVSVRLVGAPTVNKTLLLASLIVRTDGKDEEEQLGTVSLMQPLPFAMRVNAGTAAITFGEWQRELKIPSAVVAGAKVSCSTGEFLFEKLDLGAK